MLVDGVGTSTYVIIIYHMFENTPKRVHAFCALPFIRAKVSADGNLNMCCHQSDSSYLGNLFEDAFEDLWFSNLAESIRDNTRRGLLHEVCNTTECPFKYQNRQASMMDQFANANGYPTELEFDLHGSHCNFGGLNPTVDTACIMCPRSRPGFQSYLDANPDRTDELIEKVRHIVPKLKMINVLGIAEPFWKDKIFYVLERLNFESHKNRIEIWTTSNASVFNSTRQKRFSELVNRSDIHFSIDAATPETFKAIRRSDLFSNVCDNIRSWCQERDRVKTEGRQHIVRLHNNINTLNVHEVVPMVRLAKEMGVDILTLLPTHNCGGSHADLNQILVSQENWQVFAKAQQEAEQEARQIGLNLKFSRPLALAFDLTTA